MVLFFPSDSMTCGISTWRTVEALAMRHWRLGVSLLCMVRASAYELEEEASIVTSHMRLVSSTYRLMRLGNPGGLYSASMSCTEIPYGDSSSLIPAPVVITSVSSVYGLFRAFCYLK
jgi:hypothetical protein